MHECVLCHMKYHTAQVSEGSETSLSDFGFGSERQAKPVMARGHVIIIHPQVLIFFFNSDVGGGFELDTRILIHDSHETRIRFLITVLQSI